MAELFSQVVAGLDIGSSSVKAIRLKKLKDGYELIGAEIVSVSSDSTDDLDSDARHKLYVSAVKKILKNKSVAAKKAVSAIPGDAAIIRYIKVPYMTEDELKNMIPYDAEQYIPLSMEQVVFDYEVLDEIEEDGQKKLEVLIVAVKNETMDQHLQMLKDSGLTPQAIDVDAFALCNAHGMNIEGEEEGGGGMDTVALINMGAKITSITIAEKNVPHLTRDVNIGGNNFTKEIQREFGIGYSQAEEMKKQHAVITVESDELLLSTMPSEEDDKASKILEAITPALNKMLNDIRRSFDYYEGTVKRKPVQKILLSGGSSKIKNIDRFLSERLGVPVEINYPFKNINISAKNFDFDYLRANAVHFNVALGLALRAAGGGK
ncbi:MAG: type IV pilus assembly protein PilM [Candidatus Goldiibacteriota bacterium]